MHKVRRNDRAAHPAQQGARAASAHSGLLARLPRMAVRTQGVQVLAGIGAPARHGHNVVDFCNPDLERLTAHVAQPPLVGDNSTAQAFRQFSTSAHVLGEMAL